MIALPAGFQALAPVLKALGIDLKKIERALGRAQVEKRMNAAVPKIAAKLEKEGVTPAQLADAGMEAALIKSIHYQLWRACFPFPGGSFVTDIVRDPGKAKVIAAVVPLIGPESTLPDVVQAVKAATLELAF